MAQLINEAKRFKKLANINEAETPREKARPSSGNDEITLFPLDITNSNEEELKKLQSELIRQFPNQKQAITQSITQLINIVSGKGTTTGPKSSSPTPSTRSASGGGVTGTKSPSPREKSNKSDKAVNESLPMGKSKPAQDAANTLNSIVSKIEMPNLSQKARVAASEIISLIDQDQAGNMEESIESTVNEALSKFRKRK